MSDEFIRREAALSALENADPDVYEDYGDGTVDWGFGRKNVQDMINGVPAADVVEVVRGKPVVKVRPVTITEYHEEIGRFAADGSTLYRKNMVHAEIPYKHCPVCGATLCSRWYNYCGKCGAKMDGGDPA
nr:MAG TPA: 30S ribosomal protein S11 [Caudoviricetes sp.]